MAELADEQEACRIFEDLLTQGVIVRPLKAFGIPNCIRISTGTDEENQICIEAFRRSYAANVGKDHAA